jgi:hypothetical protein
MANFIFKQLDPSLSVSNLKELNDVLRGLNSPYQTIKASTDEKSWEKLLKILSWASKIVSTPASSSSSHLSRISFQCYQEKLKGDDYQHLLEDYILKLPSFIQESQENLESRQRQIESIRRRKDSMQNSLVDDKLMTANEEMYKEVERLTEIEADYKFLYKYNQVLWEAIRKKLGGRNLNNELLACLKQEQQEIHANCIEKISEIIEIDGFLQSFNEKNRGESENKEKVLFDYQDRIEVIRKDNGRILKEIKNFNEKTSEEMMEVNTEKTRARKEENFIRDVITEDRESISKHARIIADLLETVELNSF